MDIAQVETTLAKRNIKAINFATRWVARRLSKYCSEFVGTEKRITLSGVSLLQAREGELCCQDDDISYKTSRHVTLLYHWATQALKGMSHCLHRTSYLLKTPHSVCACVMLTFYVENEEDRWVGLSVVKFANTVCTRSWWKKKEENEGIRAVTVCEMFICWDPLRHLIYKRGQVKQRRQQRKTVKSYCFQTRSDTPRLLWNQRHFVAGFLQRT